MRTKSAFLLIFMVLFTIILPNNQLISRIKTNLTLTELEPKEFLPVVQITHPLPVTFTEGPDFLILELPEYKEHFQSNPTVNVLYLAHSPPTIA